jgi:hypothetical protein
MDKLAASILGRVGEGSLVARVVYLVDEKLLLRLAVLEVNQFLVGLELVVHVGGAAVFTRGALQDLGLGLAEAEKGLLQALKAGVTPIQEKKRKEIRNK